MMAIALLETKSTTILVAQHCDPPPYRAIGYSYTYRAYVFQERPSAGYRAMRGYR